jgi:hypothetical protein
MQTHLRTRYRILVMPVICILSCGVQPTTPTPRAHPLDGLACCPSVHLAMLKSVPTFGCSRIQSCLQVPCHSLSRLPCRCTHGHQAFPRFYFTVREEAENCCRHGLPPPQRRCEMCDSGALDHQYHHVFVAPPDSCPYAIHSCSLSPGPFVPLFANRTRLWWSATLVILSRFGLGYRSTCWCTIWMHVVSLVWLDRCDMLCLMQNNDMLDRFTPFDAGVVGTQVGRHKVAFSHVNQKGPAGRKIIFVQETTRSYIPHIWARAAST